MQYQKLQSVSVAASPTEISCCGGSSTLSTTAYFKLITKTEDDTTTADTETNAAVTASYSDEKSYTTIEGNKITFDKNAINYPTTSKADARDSIVTGSYTYSGVTETNTVKITQSENNVGGWVWISDTTTSIAISPTTLSFGSCEQTIDYSVTRYYDSYYEKYDSCSVKMDSKTDNNNMAVTPSEATADGSFSATTTNVSIGTNTGAYRSGTLTVKYDGHSDTSSLEQAASQQGRYYGAAYGHSYDFYTTVDNSTISCDGGSATFKSYYYSYYKKDYVDKDHCGTEIGTGTAEYPNTSDVTTSSVWTTNVGEITNGSLSIGSTTSDRTITVQASYGNYSHTNYAYQSNCTPLAKTPITVKFCGTYESKEWDESSGDCDMPQNEQIITSDISYEIIGVTTIPSELKIFANAVKYHLGKHIEWEVEFTPSSTSGIIGSILFTGEGTLIASGLCSTYEQTEKVYNWGAYLTDNSTYELTVDDRVNGTCDDSSGSGGTEPDPEITGIYIQNNQNGVAKISVLGNNYTLDKGSNQTYAINVTNNGTVDIEYQQGNWCSGGSCFVFVSIVGTNLKTVDKWNNNVTIQDESDGYKLSPNSSSSCSATLSTRSGDYTVTINVKYIGS